jgi:PAS domain S-box-containing protein
MSIPPAPQPLAGPLALELLERAPWGIYLVSAEFRIAYMNPSARRGAFRNVPEVVGRPFDEAMRILWPEAVADEIVAIFRHTLDTGQPFHSSDFVQARQDVDAVEGYEWELQRVDLPGGGPGVICYYYDSTLLRATEAALRRSEAAVREALERSMAISEATPDFVWVSDAQGRAEYVNSRWMTYTGYTLERLNAEGWQVLNHPDDAPRLVEEWAAAVEARRPLEVEFRYRRHDGAWRWFLGRTVPMLDERGEVLRWVGITTDIHDRKLMEEALRAKAHALQEADAQKNRFLATLAHELRNPMAPIRYAAALLGPQTPPPTLAKVRDIIERQSAQMARLLDDLLDMSRITRDVVELQKSPTELGRLVREAVETATHEALARGHELVLQLPDRALWVDGDAPRLHQVVGNLLSNAIKYTPRGGRIEVALSADGAQLQLAVRDNGVGLSGEMLPQLFQLFSQLHRGLEVSSSGLGIGLAVARRLVELHGGRLEAASEGLGRGAEFRLRLPLSERPVAMPAAAATSAATARPARRVLIVDDNEDAARTLADLLAADGHDVQVALSGTSALDQALARPPDIVVLDLGLPDLDGVEVARRLRAQAVTRHAVLVAVTGWGQEADRARTAAAGFDVHLVKPVDPLLLQQAVRSTSPA